MRMMTSRMIAQSFSSSGYYSGGHYYREDPKIQVLLANLLSKIGHKSAPKRHHFQSSSSKASVLALLIFNIAVIIAVFRHSRYDVIRPYRSNNIAEFMHQGTVQMHKAPLNSSDVSQLSSEKSPSIPTVHEEARKKEARNDKSIVFQTKTQNGIESTWNKSAVLDPAVSEHIFTLQNLDHVTVFKPLCFRIGDDTAFTTINNPVCSGPLRVFKWLPFFCSTARKSVYRELHLDMHHTMDASQVNRSAVWIEDTTALLVLDRSCGNVAHFAGRATMLHHVLRNAEAYVGPSGIKRVMVLPSVHVSSRFRDTQSNQWHYSLTSAIVSPAKLVVSSLEEFLKSETDRGSKDPRKNLVAHVVDDLFSNSKIKAGNSERSKEYVCFRKAVVPGFLKGRFFVGDDEYPSGKQGWGQSVDGSVNIPRDSEALRHLIGKKIGQSQGFTTHQRSIVLLDRSGSRRIFDEEGREKILDMMKKVANANKYSFRVISFDGMTFAEQINAVRGADVAIGLHGANLVNTMFMNALSVLIEIMPFGFKHEMYKNGGNAGLKYFVHQMSQGEDYEALGKYKSVEECIKRNEACKVYYRDAVQKVSQKDLRNIQRLLETAIVWRGSL